MLSVTADTNIYVSALNFPKGIPRQFLKLAQDRVIRLDISDVILNETLGVLRREFDFTPNAIFILRCAPAAHDCLSQDKVCIHLRSWSALSTVQVLSV